jgi:hypothetical protein
LLHGLADSFKLVIFKALLIAAQLLELLGVLVDLNRIYSLIKGKFLQEGF